MSNIATGTVYTTTVKHNIEDDEYYIEFEGEMLEAITEMGWVVGDEMEWHVIDNRAVILMNRSLQDRVETEEEKKEKENDNSL